MFPIKGWMWVFYIWGWFTGALNLLFWIWQYVAYRNNDKSSTFIRNNPKFHKRVYYWGIFIIIITMLVKVLEFLFL